MVHSFVAWPLWLSLHTRDNPEKLFVLQIGYLLQGLIKPESAKFSEDT